ncbi:MAG: M13 family peptidase [Gammaproteobacteria bacterium]|nr:MAG: M13 family peptidase [Gammaproteobacteria bacterium]
MKKSFLGLGALLLVTACTQSPKAPESAVDKAPLLTSGIDRQYFDPEVRIQDDANLAINGGWLKTAVIPADKSSWGAFLELREQTLPQLQGIIERASLNSATNAESKKIADLFYSYIDEPTLEAAGIKPLQQDLDKIAALKNKSEIAKLIAELNRIGVTTPYEFYVHQDAKDSTRYVVDLSQSGLGLPDRDYYLKDDDKKLKDVRTKYLAHIEKILTLSGDKNFKQNAKNILALETALAKAQWTKVENRDPVKTYNRVELNKLETLAPGYDWNAYLTSSNIKGKVDYVVVSQPSFITEFNRILKATDIAVWRAYFRWHLLSHYSAYLSKPYADENFSFYGTVLRGVPEQEPRWKRGVKLTESSVGELLGKLYVAEYFPPDHKARMEKLVGNLLAAYKESINTLDWMSPATKQEAQAKLATFNPKIGYPNKWIDYSSLLIKSDDLIGNLNRATIFEYNRNLDKLGKPIDRDEWGMTPQTVNAYYNPELNEIVFPAAIMQPPFFNIKADDAVNYGAIGAVIGHEISHGFDDQGAQYDGLGNLRDWWTKEDHEKFEAKTSTLIKQYNAFSPVPGYNVNGELTLGENIADNSGLAIAYKAYLLSLNGKPAPIIDGLTGEQRFYIGFTQVWRGKMRDEEAISRIKTDPHSPTQFRVLGTLKNQPGFYKAFDLKPEDKMYLAPQERVIIW